MNLADLYERDYYEWTVHNAELLRSGRANEADLEHIAEEIEDLGRRERRELESRLSALIAQLLRWQVQPDRRSRNWEAMIRLQRSDLVALLSENPSLRPRLLEKMPDQYERAVVTAMAETLHPESDFPSTCPFPLETILDPDFLP